MKRPSILWLVTDEQRRDSLGCYGSSWAHTPHIDALARDGAVFETAITPSPVCTPARTSVLTGQLPARTGVWDNRPGQQAPYADLVGIFRDAGYRTGSFGKHHYALSRRVFETEVDACTSPHVDYFGYASDYDEAQHDVVKYPGRIYTWVLGGRYPADPSERTEAQVIETAIHWLEQGRAGEPFFLRISFNGPHTPVTPPPPFDTMIDPTSVALPRQADSMPPLSPRWLSENLARCASSSVLTPDQIRKMRSYYYGEVSFLDHLFGRLLDWMTERGLLDDCIVAYWSDHGTHLGDHGLVQKQTFFEPVVSVPFLFRYPQRIAAGTRFKAPVATLGVLPTLLELAGLDVPADLDAPSLATVLLSGREPEPQPVFSELRLGSFEPHVQHDGRLVMVRDGDWELSVCLDPEIHDEALYDVCSDPHERRNLAADRAHRSRRDRLLRLILAHVENVEQPLLSHPLTDDSDR